MKGNLFKSPLPISASGILINPAEIEHGRLIGSGSCGEVSEAMWKGTRVAVKKIFRTLLHGDTAKEFQVESDMLKSQNISNFRKFIFSRRLRHPNIILLMGTCVQGDSLCIVTEFAERGSLR
jgi:hypothetical protein